MSPTRATRAERRDYYEVLGVERGVSSAEMKSAYRRIAVQFHPDRNPGDKAAEEKFKEAAEAYSVLSDADKRARYDRFGHAGFQGGPQVDPTMYADLSDIFGDLFGFGGGGRGRGNAAAGADLRYDLELTFEEAAIGKEVELEIPRLETCDSCSGSGAKTGTSPKRCDGCGGRGQVRFQQGFFTMARTCPKCGGAGEVITDPCLTCKGQGRVEKTATLKVTIPAGVDRGARMRLSGEGESGRGGGPTGDLYVVLDVEEHPRFTRDGAHVRSDEVIPVPVAILGGEVELETLHGKQTLEIPPGTQAGREFRLRGKGVARLDGRGLGDHLATVRFEMPHAKEIDDETATLLRRWAEIQGAKVREPKSVLGKVKEFFS